jgi:hypothetical protein
MELNQGWKPGPLPAGTWHWGAIVTKSMAASFQPGNYCGGMLYADFCGDHVKSGDNIYKPEDIAYYNNTLMLPNKKYS